MKKNLLSFLFLMLTSLIINAQTTVHIYGYVNDINGVKIPNHTVQIKSDSSAAFYYTNSALTDTANGQFMFTILNVPTSGPTIKYYVYTVDCNNVYHYDTVINLYAYNSANFYICNGINQTCHASYTLLSSNACFNVQNFYDNSTGSPNSWTWNFGDGTTGTGQYPVHAYHRPGTYIPSLTITNALGCINTYNAYNMTFVFGSYITCKAQYIYTQDTTSGNTYNVHFLNASMLNYPVDTVSYLWDFGDSTISTAEDPVHLFQNNGVGGYNVRLIMNVHPYNVPNNIICSDTVIKFVPLGSTLCNFQNTITAPNQDSVYNFSGSINTNYPTTYNWNFGDGTNASGQSISHTFTPLPSGITSYNVCLVTNTTLPNSTVCPDTSCINIVSSCHAGFGCHTDSISPTHYKTYFNNGSSSSYSGCTVKYLWYFGDGDTSTLKNPVHLYTTNVAGGYNVSVVVTTTLNATGNPLLCSDSTMQFVHIGSPFNNCQNSFTYTHQNLSYTFTGNIIPNNNTSYYWKFGDGTAGAGQTVTHTFNQPLPGITGDTVKLITYSVYPENTYCFDSTTQFIPLPFVSGTIVQGKIKASNVPVTDGYLLLYMFNSGVYSLLDSIILDSTGYFKYNYVNIPPTNPEYLLKAVLNTTSPIYSNYFPTYYLHTLNWYNADTVKPAANFIYYNINLIPTDTNAFLGSGSIAGTVTNYGTKSSFLKGVQVILMDGNNNPLAMKLTDASGHYLFSNLVVGNYKLIVEMTGKSCTIASVTLSSGNQNLNNINFGVNGDQIILLIDESVWLINHISDIYPNPSNGDATIDFSLLKQNKIKISIFNNIGQLVSENEKVYKAGMHKVNLETNQLTEGFYNIQIMSNNSIKIIKKFIKIK